MGRQHEGAMPASHIEAESQPSFPECMGFLSHVSPILYHLQSLVKSKTAPGEWGSKRPPVPQECEDPGHDPGSRGLFTVRLFSFPRQGYHGV